MIGSLAERLDQPTLNWVHTFTRALRALIAGDTDHGEPLATEALQLGTESGQPDAMVFFGAQLRTVNVQRGTMGELVPLIEQMSAEMPDVGSGVLNGWLAAAHADGGRFDDARHLLEEFAAQTFDIPLDQVWLPAMLGCAEAAAECRDP